MPSIHDLITPALLVASAALEHNLRTMPAALPSARLRPHVKAHKCTALARRQAAAGRRGFCCATVREMIGMAAAVHGRMPPVVPQPSPSCWIRLARHGAVREELGARARDRRIEDADGGSILRDGEGAYRPDFSRETGTLSRLAALNSAKG